MAGVSTATVSRVINQTAWVEPVTRERVEKAMRDLNYRRNAAAIALAKRSGDMLGLLTGNLADPFFARLARGVEDVSRKQQYRLMVCSGGHDEEMEKAGLDFLVNQGCEAIVVHASRLPDKELLRYAAHFPALVVVNRYIAGMANRCIWLENRSAARELTHPGDGVVVQGPYYGSFAKIITLNGRKLLENPLSESPDDGYQMDFCQLERLFRHERPPLMILCNPHNPTGRCWSANELEQLLLLCEAYDVTLISDEIWADLLLPGETFTSVLHLGERWHKRVISATAASKTFGLSSLRISNFLIPDPTLRQRFLSRLDAHGLDVFNALSVQAATTAWNESRQWLDSLLDYLAENRRWFVEQATEHLPWARIVPAQGTYLLWMDCKKLGLDDEQLKWVMADVAGIAPSMGSGFGPAGSGFIRLNLGCPRTYLEMAIDGLKRISVKTIKGIPTGG